MTCCSSSADLVIYSGDTAPLFAIDFPYDINGSEIQLALDFGSYSVNRSSNDPGSTIIIDGSRVTIPPILFNPPEWSIKSGRYSIKRLFGGGQVRTYLVGNIVVRKTP